MQPVRFVIIIRAARWEHINVPFRLTESTLSHSESVISRKGRLNHIPVLFDQNVYAAKFCLHGLEQSVHVRGRGNISFNNQTFLPICCVFSAIFRALFSFMSAMTRSAPALANVSAIVAPMPRPAPVTMAGLPLRSMTVSDFGSMNYEL